MATKIKGIDISYHDGIINFQKVLNDGIKFIVLRQGYRKTIDKKFLEYAKECKKYHIPIMIYHFIYTDGATPKENAQSTVANLKKANLDYKKIWISADLQYDTWKKNGEKCTKAKCTKYTKQYLDQLKKLGCKKLFIYANDDYYENYYDWSQLKGYPIWLANFSRTTPKHNCAIFQYSQTGRVSGINAKVDMNYLYDKDMFDDAAAITAQTKKTTITTEATTNKTNTATQTLKVSGSATITKTVKIKARIIAHALNIRIDAGKDNAIVASPLQEGTIVTIIGEKTAKDGSLWYQINYLGKEGYVSSKYVEKITEEKTNEKTSSSAFAKYINSTGIHYISNCSSDERGKWRGGSAGDQTGKEWCLKAWYNRPWNYVLRHPNEKVRLKIAELGIKAALNDKIGYDQNQRTTYWTQLKANKYDPSKISTKCEADCSAGVIANTRAAGNLLNIDALKNLNASYTGDMRSGFKKAGFMVLTDKKYTKGYEYLLPGDILLYEGHHTATNITRGKKV